MCLSWFGLGLQPRTPREVEEDRKFMNAVKQIKTLRVHRSPFGMRLSMDAEELRPELEKLHTRKKEQK